MNIKKHDEYVNRIKSPLENMGYVVTCQEDFTKRVTHPRSGKQTRTYFGQYYIEKGRHSIFLVISHTEPEFAVYTLHEDLDEDIMELTPEIFEQTSQKWVVEKVKELFGDPYIEQPLEKDMISLCEFCAKNDIKIEKGNTEIAERRLKYTKSTALVTNYTLSRGTCRVDLNVSRHPSSFTILNFVAFESGNLSNSYETNCQTELIKKFIHPLFTDHEARKKEKEAEREQEEPKYEKMEYVGFEEIPVPVITLHVVPDPQADNSAMVELRRDEDHVVHPGILENDEIYTHMKHSLQSLYRAMAYRAFELEYEHNENPEQYAKAIEAYEEKWGKQ